MTGQSFSTLKNSGKKHAAMSHQNGRTGPSNKNLGPSRNSQGNPAGTVRGLAGKAIRGPDKGAGTS